MKTFIFSTIVIITASALLQQFLPWWSIAIAGFAVGYFAKQNSLAAFLSGFIAVFLLWSLFAFLMSAANDNLLATKVACILPLQGKVSVLLAVTGLVGGLVSGFATLTGSLAANLSATKN